MANDNTPLKQQLPTFRNEVMPHLDNKVITKLAKLKPGPIKVMMKAVQPASTTTPIADETKKNTHPHTQNGYTPLCSYSSSSHPGSQQRRWK